MSSSPDLGRVGNLLKEFLAKRKLQIIWFLAAAVMVGLDRLTKWLVVENMELKETINIIKFGDTEVLNIYYCLNNGAAFSKLQGHRIFLIVFTALVIAGLLVLMFSGKLKRHRQIAALGLVIGGGVGNLIDRIFNEGLVVDFIDFRIINFPVFNVADICAVCGAGLMILTILIDEIRAYKKKKSNPADDEKSGGKSDGKA